MTLRFTLAQDLDVQVLGTDDSWAIFSNCQAFRYALGRVWDATLPPLAICGLNPSTATHTENDPTIRRELDFAERGGFGALLKVNAFALRSTDPEGLVERYELGLDPNGPYNDEMIRRVCAGDVATTSVAAWGKPKPHWKRIRDRLLELKRRHVWSVLKLTDDGKWPRHPLYLKKTCEIQPWVLS